MAKAKVQLSGDMDRRVDRIVRNIAAHCSRTIVGAGEHEKAEQRLKRKIARFKASVAQLERRAEHWREIAAARR